MSAGRVFVALGPATPSVIVALSLFGKAYADQGCDLVVANPVDLFAAVASAEDGGVVCVLPGRYALNTSLVLARPVTLRGPMAGIDPRPTAGTRRRPGDPTIEAILDGGPSRLDEVVVIRSSDVTLDGLEVANGTGDVIVSRSAPTRAVRLSHLIVQAAGDEGIQLRGVAEAEIAFNYVFDTEGDAINLCCGATEGRVHHNEVRDVRSTNGAMYFYESGNGASGWTEIADNVVRDVRVNDGIRLGARGTDASRGGYRVVRNEIDNVAGDAITVYVSRTEVLANDIRRTFSTHGAIHATYAIDGLLIADNLISADARRAVRIGDTRGGPSGVVVSRNCFDGAVGVSSSSTRGQVDARQNWWADPSGPSGLGAGAGAAVDGDVRFDEHLASRDGCAPDSDGDGDPDQLDCAPLDPTIHRGTTEICDGIDQDCDGTIDELAPGTIPMWRDADGDGIGRTDEPLFACTAPQPGFVEVDGDCDDDDPRILGPQILAFRDGDGDGYGDPDFEETLCDPAPGFVELGGDCDDDDPTVYPGAPEQCDGKDNDCNGRVDDKDTDGDGFIDTACGGDDCDDRDYRVHPDAVEACFDGIDNNCNGLIDEEDPDCPRAVRQRRCGCSSTPWSGATWLLLVAFPLVRRRRMR